MYLTIKQQVKHLSKADYNSIGELCHAAKNHTDEAIYNVRQYYFTEGEFLKVKEQSELQVSEFKYGSQQILKEVYGS